MAHMNIFDSKAFDLVSMLNAIDRVEYRPNRLQSLNLTTQEPVRTTAVSIEKRKEGALKLVPTTPRATPLTRLNGEQRDLRSFETRRVGEFDKMYAHEIQNVRAFGSESELQQMQSEVARRLERLDADISLTEEHMLLGMIQGRVIDADGSLIYDWFDEWGVTEAGEVNFDFAGRGESDIGLFRQDCRDIKRRMRDNAKGMTMTGVHALCGDEFYDSLVTHPAMQETYKYQEGARLRDQISETFTFGGITFENYRGTDDKSTVAIEADKARFFPTGARGLFLDVRAPGESFAVANQPGRRRYAQVIRDRDRDEWVQIEAKTYPLHVCTHPAVLQSAGVAA